MRKSKRIKSETQQPRVRVKLGSWSWVRPSSSWRPLLIKTAIIVLGLLLLALPAFFGSPDAAVDNGSDTTSATITNNQVGYPAEETNSSAELQPEPEAADLPLYSIIPFIGMLLSIAIIPLLRPHWWERNLFYVAIFWSLTFLIPFLCTYNPWVVSYEFYEIILLDYLPFIVLLWGLFAVTGSIVVRCSIPATPVVNVVFLAIGALLASWVGTTGASMLLIRTVLRANAWRRKRAHTIVFFIFIVANLGGCLTPIGDPPLFLGFLRGVPFFWTMNLLPLLLFNAAILLLVFFIIDKFLYKRELRAGRVPHMAHKPIDKAQMKSGERKSISEHVVKTVSSLKSDIIEKRIQLKGLHNLAYLALIIVAVIVSGAMGSIEALIDPTTGDIYAIPFLYGIGIPVNTALQIVVTVIAGLLATFTAKKEHREYNEFGWEPIKEVAFLFIGVFITMIPALDLLSLHGASLGITEAWQFFWVTGALSSFLDNAPTYLVFLTTAGSLGLEGLMTDVGSVSIPILLAVSAGAVFMGANTYIGNAPNFMVRSIAEKHHVKMPSFFGYMVWSAVVLVPLFLLDTLLFFVI